MKIIDGNKVAITIKEKLSEEIIILKEQGLIPGLAVVIVGKNPASLAYVNSKEKACKKLGIYSERHDLDDSISEEELLHLIHQLNGKESIHGILVQLPLPKHIDTSKVIEAIHPKKDVDGFHPLNVGKVFSGMEGLKPCTPYGIIKLLEFYSIDISGKHTVILGRSNIVGKPAAALLLQKNATVTVCHSKTEGLTEILKTADIVVAAIGQAMFVKKEMIKEGAVVIDVGINRVDDRLVGDVDFEAIKDIASYITPVPGGVGPMTIAMLMYNTVQASKNQFFDAN
ncbi:MAG: bifunctional methylenetetrahydrofolate dehydrogenase/methenyltetrahydrofolate cyclohydrolase FolD [Clostridia bacterium]|nr:bifunctional methylenetetrahydrofolate dehydrogenase/methenyltetrahydrofolate cyclohydrolase FolD [Clostridia bacterium]